MLKQFWIRKRKILKGILNTYILPKGKKYDNIKWWNTLYYLNNINDAQTISPIKNPISTKYHYNSIELLINKYFYNEKIKLEGANVLDIGTGAGHWVDFYLNHGVSKIFGIELSVKAYEYLQNKYSNNLKVNILNGRSIDQLDNIKEKFDIVNAIGVMFHITDDEEWEKTIEKISNKMKNNAIFIVGGNFGILNNLNVQIDKQGWINKKLRSKKKWIKTLEKYNLKYIKKYYNFSYLYIKDSLPENNILIFKKIME